MDVFLHGGCAGYVIGADKPVGWYAGGGWWYDPGGGGTLDVVNAAGCNGGSACWNGIEPGIFS